jgi:hypothetical protein
VVGCFELKRSTSLVGIAFLSCLGRFWIGLDVVNYLFSLNDKVRAKDRPFAIQSFEGCHLETLLITVVVRELSQRQTLVPFVWVG